MNDFRGIEPADVAFVFGLFLRRMRTKSRRTGYRRAAEEFGRALVRFLGHDDFDDEPDDDRIPQSDTTSASWAAVLASGRRLDAEFARIEEGSPGASKDDPDWLRQLLGDLDVGEEEK
jgi:hypothetical protein